ncbi:MAG: hypothetical protein EOP87_00165 [Verrucomicrobiaceae bacterium]|nr:MAG: hypothetical protein EOP87_00165 [Verrucomicrobiaceae bacterium]
MDPLTVYLSCKYRDSAAGIQPYASAWWRGAPVTIRGAIYNQDGTLSNLTGITAVRLSITNAVNGGPGLIPWFQEEYPSTGFDTDLTLDQWAAKTAWHFEIPLTGEDTLLPVRGVSTAYWGMLEAKLTGGAYVPLAGMQISLRSAAGGSLDRDALGHVGALTFGGIPIVFDPSA